MEHINIIAKEEITEPISWPIMLLCTIAMAAMIGILIYLFVTKNILKTCNVLFVVVSVLFVALLVILVISNFFRVPTGRYKYEATVDKDKITVSEYEKFIEEYNPAIKDGIYYWEDKEE